MDDLLKSLSEALHGFGEAAAALADSPDENTAEEACLACRTAVQFFFFACGDFHHAAMAHSDELIAHLDVTENSLKDLVEKVGEYSVVRDYLDNVRTRRELVDALVAGDVAKVKAILREHLQPC